MKRFVTLMLTALVAVMMWGRRPSEVPNAHVARATAWVSNPDGVMSPAGQARADAMLDSLHHATTAEIAVVVVENLDGQDIDSYTTELFELWGIGKKDRDNGLLMVISRDDCRAAIRTGYGMEGVINDGRAGRIIRSTIAPHMKEGDADSAVLEAVAAIGDYIADPEAADYLYSSQPDGGGNVNRENDFKEFLKGYGVIIIIAVTGLLVWIIAVYAGTRRQPDQVRYRSLERIKLPALMITAMSLGVGIIGWLLLWLLMRHTRLHSRCCPNCGTRMNRVDEVHDNDYLTPSQDMEEKLNSVDYDVWLCPRCNETDIIPYENKHSAYSTCPHCGARANSLLANRILTRPTTRHDGRGVRIYRCRNCGQTTDVPYAIAKVAEPPVIIGGIGGGGRGIGGGGFSGGSFGGGMTGGGGASGGW